MTIRKATNYDLPPLWHIINYYRMQARHAPQPPGNVQEWLYRNSMLPYTVIVAEEDGRILGYASLTRIGSSTWNFQAESIIFLAPSHTGMGVGTKLMESLLQRARRNGLKVVTALIDPKNKRSIKFHEKIGFCHAGIKNNAGLRNGRPREEIVMQYAF